MFENRVLRGVLGSRIGCWGGIGASVEIHNRR